MIDLPMTKKQSTGTCTIAHSQAIGYLTRSSCCPDSVIVIRHKGLLHVSRLFQLLWPTRQLTRSWRAHQTLAANQRPNTHYQNIKVLLKTRQLSRPRCLAFMAHGTLNFKRMVLDVKNHVCFASGDRDADATLPLLVKLGEAAGARAWARLLGSPPWRWIPAKLGAPALEGKSALLGSLAFPVVVPNAPLTGAACRSSVQSGGSQDWV